MAQHIKALTTKPDELSLISQRPPPHHHQWKREPIPISCPLTATCMPGRMCVCVVWVCVCVYNFYVYVCVVE